MLSLWYTRMSHIGWFHSRKASVCVCVCAYVCVCTCVCVHVFDHVWVCYPIDYSPPGFSAHGILQARILEWVAILTQGWYQFLCFGHLIHRQLTGLVPEAGEDWGQKGKRASEGWGGWMESPTQWTWAWANSRRWWGTGRPGMLEPMGSQKSRRWLTLSLSGSGAVGQQTYILGLSVDLTDVKKKEFAEGYSSLSCIYEP